MQPRLRPGAEVARDNAPQPQPHTRQCLQPMCRGWPTPRPRLCPTQIPGLPPRPTQTLGPLSLPHAKPPAPLLALLKPRAPLLAPHMQKPNWHGRVLGDGGMPCAQGTDPLSPAQKPAASGHQDKDQDRLGLIPLKTGSSPAPSGAAIPPVLSSQRGVSEARGTSTEVFTQRFVSIPCLGKDPPPPLL